MDILRRNVMPVSVFFASISLITLIVVHVVLTPRPHSNGYKRHARSLFPPTPGREVTRIISPDGAYLALTYSSDGAGVVPEGTTVMLQPLRPVPGAEEPIVVASAPSESVAFQGIRGVSWVERHTLEIESYENVNVPRPDRYGVHVRIKRRYASEEMP